MTRGGIAKNKNPAAGMMVLIVMPLIYFLAAALVLCAAVFCVWSAWQVWSQGFFEPFLEWSHESGRLFTRRTDLAFTAFLLLLGTFFFLLAAIAFSLPYLAWRDYHKKIRGFSLVPVKKVSWLSPLLDRAFAGTGVHPDFREVRFDAGVDVSMGCENTVLGGLLGRSALTVGLTGLFHVDGETLGHMLRLQAQAMKNPFAERMRASLAGMCEIFWRMASARDARPLELSDEPEFPPSFSGRRFILYPSLAAFLLVSLRQAKDRLESDRDRKQLEINLRKTRPGRARAVRTLCGMPESVDGVLPDDLPLFLLNGFKIERLHMGAFRADVWENVPEGNVWMEMENFAVLCKAATREIYAAWDLDAMPIMNVDDSIERVNELIHTDPLFAQ